MKKTILQKGSYLLLLLLFSCTSELETDYVNSNGINNIVMQTTGFRAESSSRTYPSINNGYVDILWSANDVVGVFPSEGSQAAFPMSSAAGTTQASFNGGGWALKTSYKYAAYYPYEFDNRDCEKIPVSYLGQKQIGKNTSTYTAAYNYMVASATTPSEGKANFSFQNMGCMVIMDLTVPEPTTLSIIVLSVDGEKFTTRGEINIMTENPTITPIAYSNELRIDLDNFTTTTTNEVVTIYFMTAPINLYDKTINVQVYDSKGNIQETSIAGKNLEAGGFYSLVGALPAVPTISNVFTMPQAGKLSELMSETQKNAITEMKIIGDINGDDIRFIREMAGRDVDGNEVEEGNLQILDLSEANIVSGGSSYYQSHNISQSNILGYNMFAECNKLRKVLLPINISTIGYCAFENCENLESITIPNSVSEIEGRAFGGCTSLSTILLPNSLETIGKYAFTQSGLKSIAIPDNVTLEEDGVMLFSECYLLETVTLPKNIKAIGGDMFYDCGELSTITIPTTVETINSGAFYNCVSLSEIFCLGIKPPSLVGTSIFTNMGLSSSGTILYVPKGCLDSYTNIWNGSFKKIVEI